MTKELDRVDLTLQKDSVSWALEANGAYSSNSMYLKLCQGLEFQPAADAWKATVPLNIKIFIWQLIRGRLPSNDQLLKRKGPSNGKCCMCSQPENATHIFFECVLDKFLWSGLRSMLSVTWNPANFTEWFNIIQGFRVHTRKILWVLFSRDRKSVV